MNDSELNKVVIRILLLSFVFKRNDEGKDNYLPIYMQKKERIVFKSLCFDSKIEIHNNGKKKRKNMKKNEGELFCFVLFCFVAYLLDGNGFHGIMISFEDKHIETRNSSQGDRFNNFLS